MFVKFEATHLTQEYKAGYYAPFVKESHIQIAAHFIQKIDIQENGALMIIAKIKSVSIPEDCLQTGGFVDLEKAGTITVSGLDSYHRTEKIARLTYAKPNTQPEKL
jgi:flavin reductase (DIM6/NTAB) family NADH-FMN oxidoreductase RutF